jgi:hypothetical protein
VKGSDQKNVVLGDFSIKKWEPTPDLMAILWKQKSHNIVPLKKKQAKLSWDTATFS